ncbi:1-aminocyclopropane-2-carboxylate synthase 2 [Colletotrichum asianum]
MPLSTRAKSAENASDGLHIWKAVDDLFHPTANPTGFATLGVSENTLMSRELSEHLHRNFKLPSHSLTYGDGMTGSKRIKAALATFLNRHLHPSKPLESAHFTITNGCSSAIEHLAWAVANPGDAFLLGRPYYNTFLPDLILRTGCKVIPVAFDNTDPIAPGAVGHYKRALESAAAEGQRVAGLIISNPHNPLGRCYSRASLLSLMRICSENDMHFISDEVYAFSPSSASDHIAANILEDEKWSDSFIQENRTRLASRYQLIVRWANSYGIPYAPGTNAAFFLWADLGSVWKRHNPGTATDKELDDFLKKLFLSQKVYVSSGKDFGSERAGWFRIVFSQDEVPLLTGLERVAAALKSRVTVNV